MERFDDEVDLAAEDALLFGGDDETPGLAGEWELAPPPSESVGLSPRVREVARRVEEEEDELGLEPDVGWGEPVFDDEPDATSARPVAEPAVAVPGDDADRFAEAERVTSEPLYVDPDVPRARRDSRPAERGGSPDAAVKARGPQRVAPVAAAPPEVATRAAAPSGRSVAVVGALAAAAVAVGALVLPSLGGEESRSAAVASPVPSATPAPVTRTVTVTVPRREKAKRSAPTSPRPKPARRVRAKRPQVVRRPAAPATAAAPVVRSAPVYRPPVYRAPSAGRSADAAFGVRTP